MFNALKNRVMIERCIFAAFIFIILWSSKNTYIINQGDFSRLTVGFLDDLSKYSKDTLSYPLLNTFYSIYEYAYISSFSWIVYGYALLINTITNTFDLQIFSALMKIAFICSLYLLYKEIKNRHVNGIFIFLIACVPLLSPSNLSYFASFYQDQLILPALPLAIALSLRNSLKSIFLAFVCMTLIASSKSQYFYVPLIFGAYYLIFNRERIKLKLILTFVSLAIAVLAIAYSTGASQFNKYHSVFFGSLVYLKDNHYPIPEKYDTNCIGADAWGNILNKEEGAIRSELGMKCMDSNGALGFKDSLGELIKHPTFIFKLPFESTMRSLYGEDYFHVFKSYNLIRCSDSALCGMAKVKDRLFNDLRFPALALFLILSLVLAKINGAGVYFIISAFGVSQLYISFLGEGYRDINKHLIGMNYAFDLLLFMLISMTLSLLLMQLKNIVSSHAKR